MKKGLRCSFNPKFLIYNKRLKTKTFNRKKISKINFPATFKNNRNRTKLLLIYRKINRRIWTPLKILRPKLKNRQVSQLKVKIGFRDKSMK